MPTWNTCFDHVVVGRVNQIHASNPYSPPASLAGRARDLITGARTDGEALLYSYTFLNHHVGAVSNAFQLALNHLGAFEECVLIDYGCGPGAAMMALAEISYASAGSPLMVHYLGIETAANPTLPIARDLFDCIRHQGLIDTESTCTLVPFSANFAPNYPWPAASAGCPVFFALCFVLAHPYYQPPPFPAPGLPRRPDPIDSVHQAVQSCRDFYGQPVQLIYANAKNNPHINFGVHAGWRRLLDQFGLRPDVRLLGFDYRRYESSQINGYAGRVAWQQATYRRHGGLRPECSPCDYQILA